MSGIDVDTLVRLGRADALAVSPCGTWLAVAVARLDADGAKYVHDLWRVDLQDAAKPALQLTRGPSDDRAPAFRRDGALGFLSNRNPRDGKPEDGDDERAQVWLLPADAGEPRPLTDEPLGVIAFRFASAGDRLVCFAPVLPGVTPEEQRKTAADRKKHGPSGLHYRVMPVRYWDHWIPEAAPHVVTYTEEGRERRDWTPDADREYREPDFDVSADGRFAVTSAVELGDDRVYDRTLRVISFETGEVRALGAAAVTASVSPRISPDGARVACVRQTRSRERLGAHELWLFDVASGGGRPLTSSWERWPNLCTWDAEGRWLLVTADDAGTAPVFRVSAAKGEVERVTELAAGGSHEQVALVPGTAAIAGLRHRFTHPPEPFRCDLRAGAKPELLARLSGFEPDAAGQVEVESFTTQSPDGTAVQSFLLKPAGAREPLPTIMWIHGGPWGQWSDGWHWRWNALVPVNAGYAIALPNPRGSTGVSESFLQGVWGNTWGEGCYADVIAVADALEARPDVDGSRMVAMGGSFGGYMTSWIGANSDRFRALVTHAGVFASSSFHGVTDMPAFWELRMGGQTPWNDPNGDYDRYSAHRYVERWRTPTLVIHGERDYRVPIGEALALFEALQRHGVESELLVFPDENHWILKPRNARVWYQTWLEFVGRQLSRRPDQTQLSR